MNKIILVIIVCFIIAFILGLFLSLADHFFKVKEDSRIEELTKMLPGINCGGCGYAGCTAFAEGLVNKKTKVDMCKVCNKEAKERIEKYLIEVLGKDKNEN